MEVGIRLYLDENLSPKIAEQLMLRGIDAVSVRDLGTLGDSDSNHLERANKLERVLVTSDVDFLRFAAESIEHAGIVFGVQGDHSIGDCCLLYTSPSPRDLSTSRMPSSA